MQRWARVLALIGVYGLLREVFEHRLRRELNHGSPKEPLIKVTPAANATYNDPELTKREAGVLKKILGDSSS